MKKSEIIVKENKLNKEDTLYQTYGCRHSNPDICSNYYLPKKCAFCTSNRICYCPPKSWKKLYLELGGK